MRPSDIEKMFRIMEKIMDEEYSGAYWDYDDREEKVQYAKDNPLMDIQEDDTYIYITIELRGINEEDIDVVIEKDCITLNVIMNGKTYSQPLRLSHPVKTTKNKISFNNGILDVILRKDKKNERKKNNARSDRRIPTN